MVVALVVATFLTDEDTTKRVELAWNTKQILNATSSSLPKRQEKKEVYAFFLVLEEVYAFFLRENTSYIIKSAIHHVCLSTSLEREKEPLVGLLLLKKSSTCKKSGNCSRVGAVRSLQKEEEL